MQAKMMLACGLLMWLLAFTAQASDTPLLAYIARVRDTTGDHVIDVDDAGVVFLARPGTGETFSLTDPSIDAMALAWSPNGRRLTFHAYYADTNGDRAVTRADDASIFVLDLDCPAALVDCTVSLARLTDLGANDRFPTWSPDGERIAFAINEGERAAIEVIDAHCATSDAGCAATRRALVRGDGLFLDPRWSPDGRNIAFLALADTNADGVLSRLEDYAAIRLVDVRTGALRELAPADSPKSGLAWSPDGAWLAYTTVTDTDGDGFIDYLYDRARVFVVSADTPVAPIAVTGPDAHAADPAWSPDGRTIAYSALTDTNGDGWLDAHRDSPSIFLVDFASGVGGMGRRALTTAATLDYAPAWSPDGATIAYVVMPAQDGGGVGTAVNRFGDIALVDARCAGDCPIRVLSPETTDDFAPVWSPR